MTGPVLTLTVPHKLGPWLYGCEPVAWFSPECLASLAAIIEWWPDHDGLTLRADDGCAAYSLQPADEYGVRRGTLVYDDTAIRA